MQGSAMTASPIHSRYVAFSGRRSGSNAAMVSSEGRSAGPRHHGAGRHTVCSGLRQLRNKARSDSARGLTGRPQRYAEPGHVFDDEAAERRIEMRRGDEEAQRDDQGGGNAMAADDAEARRDR